MEHPEIYNLLFMFAQGNISLHQITILAELLVLFDFRSPHSFTTDDGDTAN